MNLLSEIREDFTSKLNGGRELLQVENKEYPAFVIRNEDGYGVAVPYPDNGVAVAEKFESCRLHTREFNIAGYPYNRYLTLTSYSDELWFEFASVCAPFAETGESGEIREKLIKDPLSWWNDWRELLGNSLSEHKPYSVIGEMMALDKLYGDDKSILWSATEAGTHDIESSNGSFEVKSTLKRYDSTIVVHGQHQLESKKRLMLYFCRLEKSQLGVSINDMVERLVKKGYSRDELNKELFRMGYEAGASVRDEKYKCLETRKYEINDDFPKITDSSFVGDHIPNSIVEIDYTGDLDGIDYTPW